MCLAVGAYAQRGSRLTRCGAAVQERAGRDATYEHETRDELPPCVGVLCQRLPAMGRVRILQACMPEIFLAELPHLQLRRGLQTLRHEGTQPLRKPPNRGFGRKRHEEVPCRTAFRLRAQLCVAGGLDAILASQGRRNDKGSDVLRTGVALGIKLPIK